jgi:replicative DNA helicase
MTSGFSRSDLIIIAGRPSMGKCLAADSEIVLADGSITTIKAIYQSRQAKLLTLKNNWRFDFTQPSAFIDDGIKPVFRVTTRLGRCLETTLTHPYLTIQGWRKLGELKLGDKIAVPRKIDVFGKQIINQEEVKLLAYLIGNDCLTQTFPDFTNSNPLLGDEFSQCLANFVKLSTQRESSNKTRRSSVKIRLQELDLWGKDEQNKTIPDIIFSLKRSLVALFINRLFALAGCVRVFDNNQSQLSYTTVSEKLARQIQHLLLRFGIIASLKYRYVQDKNCRKQGWQLDITEAKSIKIFIDEIGIFGKEDVLTAVKKAIATKKYQTNLDLIPVEIWREIELVKGDEPRSILAKRAGIQDNSNIHIGKKDLSRENLLKLAFVLDNIPWQNLATSEIYWDEIVSIEAVGNKQVYDLTIPETHNFVANDICVHNTSFALNIAANIAKEQKLTVAIFSLEMSREQLTQRLLSSEAKIASNRLRSGRISQNEFEPLVNAVSSLSALPIYIDDTANLSVMQMRSQVRRLQAQQKDKLGLVLLDYLQLMEGSGSDNRVQELSKITRSLKGLARELNVPIIALSQLSRGVEQRNNKRPMLSDLRESGSIEQDADLVIMLYRDEYYNPDTADRGIAEIIITKHRNGPTGIVKLLFQSELTKFENWARPNNY